MTDTCTVDGCGQPRPEHQWICADCLRVLRQDLGDVPALLSELDTTLTRQDVLGSGGRRAAEPALPFKTEASEAKWVLVNTVTTTARALAEERGVSIDGSGSPSVLAARWLLLHATSLAMSEHAAEACGEIRSAVQLAYRAIDRPPELLLAGVCDADGCSEMLYARPQDPRCACRACRAEHDVVERREWMISAASDLRVTATVALGWVRLLMDASIPIKTWRSWVDRGRIVAHGVDAHGHETFRFGEVRDLAVAWMARRVA